MNGLLITILLAALIVFVIFQIPMSQQMRTIFSVIIGVILILFLAQYLGVF